MLKPFHVFIYVKKISILLVVLFLGNIELFSQNHSIRLHFGYLCSNIVTSDNIYTERVDNKDILFGAGYEFHYKRVLSPQIILNYSRIGFDDYYIFTDENGKEYKREVWPYNFDYLTLLIGNKLQFGEKIKGYLSVGVSPSILIKAYFCYPQEVADMLKVERKYNLKDKMNDFDFGVYSSIGADYSFSRFSLFLEFFVDRSLTTYTNDNYMGNLKLYNYYYSANLGIIYKLIK